MRDQEHGSVGKSQKNIWLDDQVIKLIDAYQQETGVPYTLIAQAAFLKFFFEEPTWPKNAEWIRFASRMNKFDLGLWEVPQQHLEKEVEHWQRLVQLAQGQECPNDEVRKANDAVIAERKSRLITAKQKLDMWNRLVGDQGTDGETNAYISRLSEILTRNES